MNNVIYLIRHGQTDANLVPNLKLPSNEPLNELGEKQARQLAAKLLDESELPTVIFSSEIKRARQTADIIGQILGISVQTDQRLNEYDFGIYKGKVVDSSVVYAGLNTPEDRFHFRLPEGESDEDVVTRLAEFVQDVKKLKQNIAVVTHDYPVFVIKKLLLGAKISDLATLPYEKLEHDRYLKLSV